MLLPSDFDEVLQQEFGARKLAEASWERRRAQLRRLRGLTRGPWAGIVTTNYDALIETALAERIVGGTSSQMDTPQSSGFYDRDVAIVQGDDSRLGAILARPPAGGFLVKIHGSISGANVVISTEDYGRTYLAAPRMTSFLTALMLRYHLVFIGCSLEDELVRLRRRLAIEFSRVIPPAYALMPDTALNLERINWLRNNALVECLTYSPEDGQHRFVDDFLDEAAACTDWALRRTPSAAITRKLANLALAERIKSVGDINIRLLFLISRQRSRAIEHVDLVELQRLSSERADAVLFRLSPEERVYRVLFLVSIHLVTEETRETSSPRYLVGKDVASAVNRMFESIRIKQGAERKPR